VETRASPDKFGMMTLRAMCLGLAVACVATAAQARDLIVFAAASLKGPLDEIAAAHGDVRVSYAGSGTLARQVQQGAPADVVLLANTAWMDVLVADGVVGSPEVFLGNRLVLIGQAGAAPVALTVQGLTAALGDGRLAMGFTASVPAGIYGKEAFESLGLWDAVAPSVAEVDSVRGALALVARGEVPLGVVYASDAFVVPDLAVVADFPAQSHAQIAYVGGVVTGSDHPEAAAFLAGLLGNAAQAAFADAGFCGLPADCAAP